MLENRAEINTIFASIKRDTDRIYIAPFTNTAQEREIALREKVAEVQYGDYMAKIAQHHSIPVMDHEVDLALKTLPIGALILDVGGCWGWHWRRLRSYRPDVTVFIVDFIRANLEHAKAVLGDLVDDKVHLVHGDATQLPFPNECFDLVWTVQTFQHIPDFESAVRESHRVLRCGGEFINYSFNRTLLVEFLYRIFGKSYHIEGWRDNYYLARASKRQKEIVKAIFGVEIESRFTEIIFQPDLKITIT